MSANTVPVPGVSTCDFGAEGTVQAVGTGVVCGTRRTLGVGVDRPGSAEALAVSVKLYLTGLGGPKLESESSSSVPVPSALEILGGVRSHRPTAPRRTAHRGPAPRRGQPPHPPGSWACGSPAPPRPTPPRPLCESQMPVL